MTKFWIEGVGHVETGKGFVGADGTKYGGDWISRKDALGAVEVTHGPKPDPLFFAIEEVRDGPSITYVGTPKPLAEIAADIQARFSAAIQERLDAFARSRLYDNILSACTYVASTDPKFAAEGQRCVELRDATWSAAYAILDDVLAGTRPVPTIETVFAELPALSWPE